ncbi:MAG TPA: hypothetical protein VJS92_08225 [Candidatus Polarisedimenticolaceae bacterium]|nr:hypothetical protein [Candidatus Polarisedimenticolaceae bacterium]
MNAKVGSTVMHAVLASFAIGCGGGNSPDAAGGGTASISVNDATYEVADVGMTIDAGEEPWFRIDGQPVEHPEEDCVPGLSGGLGLYGELPPSVRQASDLAGKRLRVQFSGDGDDANFCFVGMGGLAGAEEAWITIDSVSGARVRFSMSGTFKVYDENGEGPIVTATASGTALLRAES